MAFCSFRDLSFHSVEISFSMTCIFTYDVTLPQLFFKHLVSKSQLPGLSISGTLVENGLNTCFFEVLLKCDKYEFGLVSLSSEKEQFCLFFFLNFTSVVFFVVSLSLFMRFNWLLLRDRLTHQISIIPWLSV